MNQASTIKTLKNKQFHDSNQAHLVFIHKNAKDKCPLYQKYSLPKLYYPHQHQGKLLRLAYVIKYALHVEAEAMNAIEQFRQKKVAFVAICSKKGAGKSLFLNTMLSLVGIKEAKFGVQDNKGIYMWSVPFISPRHQIHVFFLEIPGIVFEEAESQSANLLRNFLLLICSSLVILPRVQQQNGEFMQQLQRILIESRIKMGYKNIRINNQIQEYWPQSIYYLYRSRKYVNREIQRISRIFKRFNFSIFHDAYEKILGYRDREEIEEKEEKQYGIISQFYVLQIHKLVLEIIQGIKNRKIQNIYYNGYNMPKILLEITYILNTNITKRINIENKMKKIEQQIITTEYNSSIKKYKMIKNR